MDWEIDEYEDKENLVSQDIAWEVDEQPRDPYPQEDRESIEWDIEGMEDIPVQPQPRAQTISETTGVREVDGVQYVQLPKSYIKYFNQPLDKEAFKEKLKPAKEQSAVASLARGNVSPGNVVSAMMETNPIGLASRAWKGLTGSDYSTVDLLDPSSWAKEGDEDSFLGDMKQALVEGRDVLLPAIGQLTSNPRELFGGGETIDKVFEALGTPQKENASRYRKLKEVIDQDGYVPVEAIRSLEIPRQEIAKLLAKAKSAQTGLPEEMLLEFAKIRGLGDTEVDWDREVSKVKAEAIDRHGIELSDREAFEIASSQQKKIAYKFEDDTYDPNTLGNIFDEALFQVPGAIVRRLRKDGILGEYANRDFVKELGYSDEIQVAISEANRTNDTVEVPMRTGQGGLFAASVTVEPGDTYEVIRDAVSEAWLSSHIADMEHSGGASSSGLIANLLPLGSIVGWGGKATVYALGKIAPTIARSAGLLNKVTIGKKFVEATSRVAANPAVRRLSTATAEKVGELGALVGLAAAGAYEGQEEAFAQGALMLGGFISAGGLISAGSRDLIPAVRHTYDTLSGVKPTRTGTFAKVVQASGETGLVEVLKASKYEELSPELQTKVTQELFQAAKEMPKAASAIEQQVFSLFGTENLNGTYRASTQEDFAQTFLNNPQTKEMLDTYSILQNGYTVTELRNRQALISTLNDYGHSVDTINKILLPLEGVLNDTPKFIQVLKDSPYLNRIWDNVYNAVYSGNFNDVTTYYKTMKGIFSMPLTQTAENLTSAAAFNRANPTIESRMEVLLRRKKAAEASEDLTNVSGVVGANQQLVQTMRRTKDLDAWKTKLLDAESNIDATQRYIKSLSDDFLKSQGALAEKFTPTQRNILGDVETIVREAVAFPTLFQVKLRQLRAAGSPIPKPVSDFVREIRMANKVAEEFLSDTVNTFYQKRIANILVGEAGDTAVQAGFRQYRVGDFEKQISEFMSNPQEVKASFKLSMDTLNKTRDAEVVNEFTKAVQDGVRYSRDLSDTKIATREFKKSVEKYNLAVDTRDSIRDMVGQKDPLYIMAYTSRVAPQVSVPHIRADLTRITQGLVGDATKSLHMLPIPVADKKALISSLLVDPVEVYKNPALLKEAADIDTVGNIMVAANSISSKTLDTYAAAYRALWGEDLNKLSFLAYYLTPTNDYDAARMYGQLIAGAAKNTFSRDSGGTRLFMFGGASSASRTFSEITQRSPGVAMRAKHSGERLAKNTSTKLSTMLDEELLNISAIRTEPITGEVWKKFSGVRGLASTKLAGDFTPDGRWIPNDLGHFLKTAFTTNGTFKTNISPLSKDITDVVEVERHLQAVASQFLPSFKKAVIENPARLAPHLGPKELERFRAMVDVLSEEELVTQTLRYWYTPRASETAWDGVFQALQVEAKYRAKIFNDCNKIIENNNSVLDSLGIKVAPYRHRSDFVTTRDVKGYSGAGVGIVQSFDNFVNMRWHRTKRSSSSAQIAKAESVPIDRALHPQAALSDYIYKKYYDAHTIHASQFLDSLGMNAISLGYQGAGEWAQQWAGQSVMSQQATKVGDLWRQASRRIAESNEILGQAYILSGNVTGAVIRPGIALAKVFSGPRQLVQGLTQFLSKVHPKIGAMAIPGIFKDLVDPRFIMRKDPFEYSKLAQVAAPSSDLNEIAQKVLMTHSDIPLSQRQASLYLYLGTTASTSRLVGASAQLAGGADKVNQVIMRSMKENWELFASKVAVDKGKVVYQDIMNSISSGDIKSAYTTVRSALLDLTDSECIELVRGIEIQTQRTGNPNAGAYSFLRTFHDSTIGSFGSNASSLGARHVASVVPGASLFWTAAMLVPVQIAQAVKGMSKLPGAVMRGDKAGMLRGAQNAWMIMALGGLFLAERAITSGIPDPTAELLDLEPDNPLRYGTKGFGVDLSGISSAGSTVGDIERMYERGMTPESLGEWALTTMLLGSPNDSGMGRNVVGFSGGAQVKALGTAAKAVSTLLASISAKGNLDRLDNDILARFKFHKLISEVEDTPEGPAREAAIQKLMAEYDVYSYSPLKQAALEIFMKQSYGQTLNNVISNPFLAIYLRDKYTQDELMYEYSKQSKDAELGSAMFDMGFLPISMARELGLDDIFGDPKTTNTEWIQSLDDRLQKMSLGPISLNKKIRDRIMQSYEKYVRVMEATTPVTRNLSELDAPFESASENSILSSVVKQQ